MSVSRFRLSLWERIEVRAQSSNYSTASPARTSTPQLPMPRFRETIPVDDYVLDVLMRDVVGHDRQPAAYLVYLYLYGQAARDKWRPVAKSLRDLADATGLSK